VLLFVVPASPMASPWAVIGGSVISTLSGSAMVHLFGATALGAGLSVGLAILAMSALRCLHPPGGGFALIAAVGGPASPGAAWGFALAPVGLNAVILVLFGMLFHRLISGHSYPHRVAAVPERPHFRTADIDAALAEMGEAFDVSREDLDMLLEAAARHADRRRK
jgi:CBS domain-containing membrane protein